MLYNSGKLCDIYNPIVCCLQETFLSSDDYVIRGFSYHLVIPSQWVRLPMKNFMVMVLRGLTNLPLTVEVHCSGDDLIQRGCQKAP